MIPLSSLYELETSKTMKQQLKGGSPFQGTKIKSSEVSARRRGWRGFVQKIMGVGEMESELEFVVSPTRSVRVVSSWFVMGWNMTSL